MIEKITDEIIALGVVGCATGCGVYVSYITGEVPANESTYLPDFIFL